MMNTDTIAAIATAPGKGGIGIIRLSGPQAEAILSSVFQPAGKTTRPLESHRLYYGWITDGSVPGEPETVDECMAVIMRAPRSYTREDVAELQLHGGLWVLNRTLDLCLHAGARLADPGEFTRRAFLNGRLDLSRAEAVMDLINASGARAHQAAVRQLRGGASAFIRNLSEKLVSLRAGLAACMDYPEEISDEEGAGRLREGLEALAGMLEGAIDEHASRLIHRGLHVALVGRPNVGKSSILNALLGEDRAIVTSVPGTTRDTVRGEMTLRGFQVILTDTAGVHDTLDPVEKIGVERSIQALSDADVQLLVLDASEKLTEGDMTLLRMLDENNSAVVINKTDLPQALDPEEILRLRPNMPCLFVCAKDPETLSPLKHMIEQFARLSADPALTQPRHLDAAQRALRHLRDALSTLECYTPDVAATDLQAAQEALCEITGERADEQLLDRVFSTFCVGK